MKLISIAFALLSILFLFGSCDKEEDNSTKLPVISTLDLSEITQTSVKSGGNITNDKGYPIVERGVCWSTTQLPEITDSKTSDGSEKGEFESVITGLLPETEYYVRAYATNEFGTAYGTQKVFTTIVECPETIIDSDNNSYSTILIGNQCWMSSNLITTKYNDGINIANIDNFQTWAGITNGAFCWYNNDYDNYGSIYGALYNWYAVKTDKLCPQNWRVPTEEDWDQLINFLGGQSVAGGKLKQQGIQLWNSPNTGASNETNFTALPGGYRNGIYGNFDAATRFGYWWTDSEFEEGGDEVIIVELSYNSSLINKDKFINKYGLAVRCIKN